MLHVLQHIVYISCNSYGMNLHFHCTLFHIYLPVWILEYQYCFVAT